MLLSFLTRSVHDVSENGKTSLLYELMKVPEEKRAAALSFLMAQKTRKLTRPNHVTIELTPLCPFSCKMCYIKQEGLKPGAVNQMLDGDQWKAILDQIEAQHVESITFTGGEVFSYQYFREVYEYTYDKGFEIVLMSNAMLIDEQAIQWLIKRPPKYICVTLYGSTMDSYGRLCGVPGAYAKVMHAIDLVQKAGLPLIMQSTITKDNVDELDAMIAFVEKRGLAFRYSANLFASRECSVTCASSEIVELKRNAERRKRIIEKLRSGEETERRIITHGTLCGAGRNSYHINWRGEMQPCILLDAYKVSVLTNTVEVAWNDVRDWTKRIPQLTVCQRCPAYEECGDHCLAAHYAETREFGIPAYRRCVKRQLEESEVR